MKRETIEFETEEEFFDVLNDENDSWEVADEEEFNFDSEKGMVTKRVIVKRESDGRYFCGVYTRGMIGNKWAHDLTLKEVFQKKITQIIYE
jgi:hypothetical protein